MLRIIAGRLQHTIDNDDVPEQYRSARHQRLGPHSLGNPTGLRGIRASLSRPPVYKLVVLDLGGKQLNAAIRCE